MNWLGRLVAARVLPTDEVLDLGCGTMMPTGGRLKCKAHVGMDSFQPYVDTVGPPAVLASLPAAVTPPHGLPDKSFDVVLLLDVVEHLDKPGALALIAGAERIARREVVLFTPDGFVPQAGWDAWGLGHNDGQAHRCGFTFDELAGMGYECSRHQNATRQHGEITSVFAVKTFAVPAVTDWQAYKRLLKTRPTCLDVIARWQESRCTSSPSPR